MPFRIKIAVTILFIALAAIILSLIGMAHRDAGSGFEKQYKELVAPYAFNFAGWEIKTLGNEVKQCIWNDQTESELSVEETLTYFSSIQRLQGIKSNLRSAQSQSDNQLIQSEIIKLENQISQMQPGVERTLEEQISRILTEQGIHNPFINRLKIIFPPVNFLIDNPPHILIISPRNKIERLKDTLLIQDMTLSQIEELETSLEKLDVSVLVDNLGGLGATYPSFVESGAGLRFTIDTACEEWLHQYLAFKPLGVHYMLDFLNISRDVDIPTLNETVAGLASQELGGLVYDKFYAKTLEKTPQVQSNPPSNGFDFNLEMQNIRLTVDGLLEKGEVDRAEQFMRERRDYLEANGYYIRKLNQAYFAFHGAYANSPTSIDPIGDDIRLLRKNSPSLKNFIDAASNLSNKQDLIQAVSRLK